MSSAANLYPAPGLIGGQTLVSTHPAGEIAVAAQASSSGATAAGTATTTAGAAKEGKLVAFEGLLKRAGHIAGVVLSDIVKYAIPVASLVGLADPAAGPVVAAFTASVKLVQATVISAQQRWVTEGSEANAQKLADVLEIVEQPIVLMFAQAGVEVDTAYVTNLVNGVVAMLNAQPGAVLPTAA